MATQPCEQHHERQNRQLCAVHTVNNLLQIAPNQAKEESHPRATKEELDHLAYGLISAEKNFLSQNSTVADSDGEAGVEREDVNSNLSWIDAAWNNHRTPWLGNYSFEVLEKSLQSRGVQLCWFDLGKQAMQKTDALDQSMLQDPKVVGFVVNTTSTARQRTHTLQRLVPWRKLWRHWFAIHKRNTPVSDASPSSARHETCWCVVDSKESHVLELKSDDVLHKYLRQLKEADRDACFFLATYITIDAAIEQEKSINTVHNTVPGE